MNETGAVIAVLVLGVLLLTRSGALHDQPTETRQALPTERWCTRESAHTLMILETEAHP
jgi:hypothetical protein